VARAVSRAGWADLDVLCLTAMHKDPARRYGSAQTLVRDVNHFLEGEPLEARPDTMSYRVSKFIRRNGRSVALATTALVSVVALVVFYTASLAAARNTAVSEAARSRRIQQFMQSLFQGGDQEAGPADSLRVITLVHRGVQEARNLSSEPVVQAELYETLGGILQQLGELGGADSMLLASLSRRQALFGVNHTEVARSLIALGHLRADQAQFDAAERMVRDGLAMSLRSLPADHPQVAEATILLGRILRERGRYADAVPVLEGAVLLNARGSTPSPELGSALLELASVRYQLGQYAAADSLSQRVLAVARALYGERHPRVADALRSIGGVLFERGKYPAAEESYRNALALIVAWYGADHAETASAQTSLARTLHAQGRYDEADQLLVAALAVRERVLGRNHPSVAETLNELGVVAYWQDRLDDADAYYNRMLDIYRGIYGERHQFVGVALSNLGNVALDRKDWAGAERLFRRMLDIFVEVLPAEHSNTAIGRIKLGRSMLRQGRFAAAVQESLAGYESLRAQTDPSSAFLRNARIDLMTAFDSLGQPDQAARFRSELLATGWKPPST
jgi:serine/threonine-protein kinase